MKKTLLCCVLAVASVGNCYAGGVLEDLGRSIGGGAKGLAKGALPSGTVVWSDVTIGEDLMIDTHGGSAEQIANKVEVSNADINFVVANTVVEGGILMNAEHCTGSCIQAVNQILIKSGGAGFSGAYASAAINGGVMMKSYGNPDSKQYINHIKIGE